MSTLSKAAKPVGRQQNIWFLGLIAVVGSVIANWITLALILAVTDLTSEFMPLNYAPVGIFTALGVAAAAIVYSFVIRRASQPIRTYWIVAVVAMVLSCIPNVAMAINPSAAPFPGATAAGFIALIVFHVVAGIVSTIILTRMASPR